jgi:3-oxoacyl-[acyl-carrier protein] reductase
LPTERPETVLITGSSRGLGCLLAERLASRGDQVVGLARSPAGFEHENYRHIQIDLTDEAEVVGVFAKLNAEAGGIRLCVNNAGVSQTSLALLTKAQTFNATLTANLTTAFLVSREALKHMKRRRFGRIVNMTSINVPMASVGGAAYNASKAGLEALMRTFVNEVGPTEDITFNALGLSLVAGSGMVEGLSPAAVQAKTARLAKPAMLDVSEVLHALDFLAAPEARNITGQTLYFGGV